MIILKDYSIVTSSLVSAEAHCPLCGAQPEHPCIGRRGPRTKAHLERWSEWQLAHSHLIADHVASESGINEYRGRRRL